MRAKASCCRACPPAPHRSGGERSAAPTTDSRCRPVRRESPGSMWVASPARLKVSCVSCIAAHLASRMRQAAPPCAGGRVMVRDRLRQAVWHPRAASSGSPYSGRVRLRWVMAQPLSAARPDARSSIKPSAADSILIVSTRRAVAARSATRPLSGRTPSRCRWARCCMSASASQHAESSLPKAGSCNLSRRMEGRRDSTWQQQAPPASAMRCSAGPTRPSWRRAGLPSSSVSMLHSPPSSPGVAEEEAAAGEDGVEAAAGRGGGGPAGRMQGPAGAVWAGTKLWDGRCQASSNHRTSPAGPGGAVSAPTSHSAAHPY